MIPLSHYCSCSEHRSRCLTRLTVPHYHRSSCSLDVAPQGFPESPAIVYALKSNSVVTTSDVACRLAVRHALRTSYALRRTRLALVIDRVRIRRSEEPRWPLASCWTMAAMVRLIAHTYVPFATHHVRTRRAGRSQVNWRSTSKALAHPSSRSTLGADVLSESKSHASLCRSNSQ